DTWVPEPQITQPPAIVIDDGATECSINADAEDGGYRYIASHGFGSTTIAYRKAYPDITSEWTPLTDAFKPPESEGPNAFVYAAKAHPMLDQQYYASFVVTYADNSFTFSDLLDPTKSQTLYWPHVVVFRYEFSAS